jgi:hypothetical protein
MAAGKYTTQLSKGQGAIPETLSLLAAWQPGVSAQELKKKVLEQGLLGRATANRVNDLVTEVFAPRYLTNGGEPAHRLKLLLDAGLHPSRLTQLFLVHTARVHSELRDFICEVYWPKYAAGAKTISREDAMSFLQGAVATGKIPKPWSDKMTFRVAQYLPGCLTDFQLAGQDHRGSRDIFPIAISPLTVLYLAHDIHFAGHSDDGVIDHPDWRVFGLQRLDVVQELRRQASKGHFIVQYAGDLLRVSWNFKNMEEALRGIAATELQ